MLKPDVKYDSVVWSVSCFGPGKTIELMEYICIYIFHWKTFVNTKTHFKMPNIMLWLLTSRLRFLAIK